MRVTYNGIFIGTVLSDGKTFKAKLAGSTIWKMFDTADEARQWLIKMMVA